MRLLCLLLVLANLTFFAWQLYFARGDAQADPRPLARQIAPEKLRILPSGASPDLRAACLDWGAFAPADAARAEQALKPLALGARLTRRRVDDSAGWWVYIPPRGDRPSAQKKVAEIRALGVEEYFIVQDEGRYKFAISLGVFKTREAAQSRLDAVQAKGVKTAQVGERQTLMQKVYLRASALDAPLVARLREIALSFAGSELQECAAQS